MELGGAAAALVCAFPLAEKALSLIGTLGAQPLDISALGTHAGTLSEGDDLFVRIRPENVVYYNNN